MINERVDDWHCLFLRNTIHDRWYDSLQWNVKSVWVKQLLVTNTRNNIPDFKNVDIMIHIEPFHERTNHDKPWRQQHSSSIGIEVFWNRNLLTHSRNGPQKKCCKTNKATTTNRNYRYNVSIWKKIFLVAQTIASMINNSIHFGGIRFRKMFLYIIVTINYNIIHSNMNGKPLNQ